ncbi:MAG: hypothetical protein J6P96_01065, partial [Bacteroidaceae bacterium]|nr:hypothetical protein [Bacteroidaceae bacterium]
MPLFHGEAEVDDVHLYDVKLNTKDLVEAAAIRGSVAELGLDSHSTDLKNGLAVVNKALLRDADLTVVLADSVAEDTTTSELVDWRIRVDDIELQHVKAMVMLAPQVDSACVIVEIGSAHANAFLDLGKEIYQVDQLDVAGTRVGYDLLNMPNLPEQLDPNHLLFEDVCLTMDSFVYKGTQEMELMLTKFAANEHTGFVIADANGRVEMDSLALSLPKFTVTTGDSRLMFAYRMDMNAFDEFSPGKFSFLGEGQIGKEDMIYFTRMGGEGTRDVCTMMSERLPALPSVLQVKAEGNLKAVNVERLYLDVPELATLEGGAELFDVAGNMSLLANIGVRDVHEGTVDVEGTFDMADETYAAQMFFDSLVVNHYVALEDTAVFSGKASVQGEGLDFFSPHTVVQAVASLSDSRFGKIDLDNIQTDVTLKGQQLLANVLCDNSQLQVQLKLDTELQKHLIDGSLDLDVPLVDIQGMGFSEERMQA